MKALSIRQPWAFSILAGGKDIENRSWPTRFRGRFLIHAAKGLTWDEIDAWKFFLAAEDLRGPWLQDKHVGHLDRGGIVGAATIVDCVKEHPSKWFNGPWGFVLADVQPLPFIPCKGALGFFTPDTLALTEALGAIDAETR